MLPAGDILLKRLRDIRKWNRENEEQRYELSAAEESTPLRPTEAPPSPMSEK